MKFSNIIVKFIILLKKKMYVYSSIVLTLIILRFSRQLIVSRTMKNNEGKVVDKSRIVPLAIIFVVLCGLSFYMGVIFGSENDRIVSIISQRSLDSPKKSASISSLQIKSISFPECSVDYQDYTPCTDPRVILVQCSIF